MTIYFVDLPIKNGDFPVRYVNVYQRVFANILGLSEHRVHQDPMVYHKISWC